MGRTTRDPLEENAMRQEFDDGIVGGGSAGCVMAARLSEIPT